MAFTGLLLLKLCEAPGAGLRALHPKLSHVSIRENASLHFLQGTA